MTATKNKKKNVSLGKPMVAGVAYRAPAGTALPADATSDLNDAFACVGFIGSDGITNATDTDTTTETDMGGVTVINEISSYAETYQFVMIETKKESLQARYGDANVTEQEDKISVSHTMPTGESSEWVFEILMTGNRVKRIVIPDATPSEFGDITYNSTTVIGYDVTWAANPDDRIDGATSKEYIAPLGSAAAAALVNTIDKA